MPRAHKYRGKMTTAFAHICAQWTHGNREECSSEAGNDDEIYGIRNDTKTYANPSVTNRMTNKFDIHTWETMLVTMIMLRAAAIPMMIHRLLDSGSSLCNVCHIGQNRVAPLLTTQKRRKVRFARIFAFLFCSCVVCVWTANT